MEVPGAGIAEENQVHARITDGIFIKPGIGAEVREDLAGYLIPQLRKAPEGEPAG
jgi:hypothetical protein